MTAVSIFTNVHHNVFQTDNFYSKISADTKQLNCFCMFTSML